MAARTTPRLSGLRRRLAGIAGVAFDVDGVLTDGGLWIADDQSEMKRFDVRDGLGLAALRRAGLKLAFVSGRRSRAVATRAKELGIHANRQGIKDKAAEIADLARRWKVDPSAIAFVGDDLVDLPAFAAAGLGIAVADARPEVLRAAEAVLRARGGHGAVRELAEALLRARGDEDHLPGLRSRA